MKLNPIESLKSAIAYIKSLGWGKEDVKKIIMFIIMLLIACFILNNFLLIKVKIVQGRRDGLRVGGYIDTSVSGSIDADVSGKIHTDTTVVDFLDDVRIRQ